MVELKDILGQPDKGIHSWRIGPFAAFDLVATIVAAYLLARWRKWSFILTLIVLLGIGEGLHYTIGVQTTFVRFMSKCDYLGIRVKYRHRLLQHLVGKHQPKEMLGDFDGFNLGCCSPR
jgi:hypothetical protein